MSDDTESEEEVIRDGRRYRTACRYGLAVAGVALGAPRDETIGWLRRHGLWSEFSPRELDFMYADEPDAADDQCLVALRGRPRAALVAGGDRELPQLHEQCDPGDLQALLPPSPNTTVDNFSARARRRPDASFKRWPLYSLPRIGRCAAPSSTAGRPWMTSFHRSSRSVTMRSTGASYMPGAPWDSVPTNT